MYLDNGVIFLGSHFGDSQLVKVILFIGLEQIFCHIQLLIARASELIGPKVKLVPADTELWMSFVPKLVSKLIVYISRNS